MRLLQMRHVRDQGLAYLPRQTGFIDAQPIQPLQAVLYGVDDPFAEGCMGYIA